MLETDNELSIDAVNFITSVLSTALLCHLVGALRVPLDRISREQFECGGRSVEVGAGFHFYSGGEPHPYQPRLYSGGR